MIRRLHFPPGEDAHAQLLAVTMLLIEELHRHPKLQLWIPRHVHESLPETAYAELLNDTLMAQYPDLEARLQLRVWSHDAFEFRHPPQGQHDEAA